MRLRGGMIPPYSEGGEYSILPRRGRPPQTKEERQMKRDKYPTGWDERKVRRVLEHYESQTEDQAVAEDEAAFQLKDQTVAVVPRKLVPEITRLIEKRRPRSGRVLKG